MTMTTPTQRGPKIETSGKYFLNRQNFALYANSKEGPTQLTNFSAWIEEEITYHDGDQKKTQLLMAGDMKNATGQTVQLPNVTIDAEELSSLAWIPQKWGMRPIVFPAPNAERDIRTAIQLFSDPIRRDVYTATGWNEINGRPVYLSKSGGISADGLDGSIQVALPQELKHYSLPAPTTDRGQKQQAVARSMKLINLGPKHLTWTLLLATYRAAVGEADFAIHVAGRTGSFKSEVASLMQSHFGVEMDARHLPASWNSTANALELLAYKARNAIMVLDDFVPVGTAWQVRQLQSKADSVIRAQGNQSGRSRMTDAAAMQSSYYPRGIILSTGEDIMEGHSVRGRMLIIETVPGEIQPAKLTEAQQARPHYPQAMALWVQWLAARPNVKAELAGMATAIRDAHIKIGHTRTPAIIGQLLATAELLAQFCIDIGLLTRETAAAFTDKARAAIVDAGNRQAEYLASSNPAQAFAGAIRYILNSKLAHLKTRGGGIPHGADRYGWTEVKTASEMPTWSSHGQRLGWVDGDAGEIYIDPTNIPLIRKHSGGQISITPQTLLKRLAEEGLITRKDATRERNTVRMTIEGHQTNVMVLDLKQIMDLGDDK